MCNFITATVKRSQRLSGSRVSTRKIFTRRSTPEILINMASMNHSLDHKSAHCEVPCTFICFTCMAVGGRVAHVGITYKGKLTNISTTFSKLTNHETFTATKFCAILMYCAVVVWQILCRVYIKHALMCCLYYIDFILFTDSCCS